MLGVETDPLPALIERLESQVEDAGATARHLQRIEADQQRCAHVPYRVFESAATGQLFVLRGAAQLDGTKLVYEHAVFGVSLAWMNQRLATRVASAEVAKRYDDLRPNSAPS